MSHMRSISTISYLAVYLLIMLTVSCRSDRLENPHKKDKTYTHMAEIRSRGSLSVVTEYNSISYFIYRGQPMGFQFELLQHLANHLELELEVSVNNDLNQNFRDLSRGEVDLIALALTVTGERKDLFSFTEPFMETCQVLVQRKPANWRRMHRSQVEDSLLVSQLELAGKTIFVQQGSVYESRLRSLSDEIGGGIEVMAVPMESEQLVQRVATGEIDYVVCDENVGKVNANYFPRLDVSLKVSFPQHIAWAVHEGSDSLRAEVNEWIREFRSSVSYAVLYGKYFNNRQVYRSIHSEHYTLGSGKVSEYDEVIKKESERIGWDWRLLASVIYQESRFNPTARSWAGAFGLMQLMPVTARSFGVSSASSPEEQIHAGVSFIDWLDVRFRDEIEDMEERRKFILASYNIGYGHIQDARRLASEFGDDPNVWTNCVENWLLKKSDPAFYNSHVVRFGYARGIETYNYVRQILSRYEHYKNILNNEVMASQLPFQEAR